MLKHLLRVCGTTLAIAWGQGEASVPAPSIHPYGGSVKQIAKLLYLTAVLGVFAFWAYLSWYKPILLQRQALGTTLTAGTPQLEISYIIYGETRWIYTLSRERTSIVRRQQGKGLWGLAARQPSVE